VGYIFENVREMASDRDCGLLVVMIDEVESLSASRAASAASAEPSDALRVVNALLTAIDTLRELPNVLVIATSNLTERIDSAFLDRADIKQYIGLPSLGARYEILRGGVCELIKCGIVSAFGSKDDANKLPFDALSITLSDQSEPPTFGQWREFDKLLHRAAVCADGLSGRSLRKLCLLAHARLPYSESSHLVPIDVFLRALGRAASSEASLRGLDSGAPT
jgi:pachytene checkpoint protein 2